MVLTSGQQTTTTSPAADVFSFLNPLQGCDHGGNVQNMRNVNYV